MRAIDKIPATQFINTFPCEKDIDIQVTLSLMLTESGNIKYSLPLRQYQSEPGEPSEPNEKNIYISGVLML